MRRRVVFRNRWLPYALLAPQLALTVVFFLWPAAQALSQSVYVTDAFGLRARFVGLGNFVALFTDPLYLGALRVTVLFSLTLVAVTLAAALGLALAANRPMPGAAVYRTLLVWPYAVAPAVAAVLMLFLFHPAIGLLGRWLRAHGVPWDYTLNGTHALVLVTLAAAWRQVSYNFIFFLAGLQAIPRSLVEAAAVDGAGPGRVFWSVVFPLLSPTTFFLVVVNLVYAFFDTFGVIDALTKGGPGEATETLMYKVYVDGFINHSLGSSAAQSVVLMTVVVLLTAVQFRHLEHRVHYG